MKYFRKHPDLVLIANYPDIPKRIRHTRSPTPTQLAAQLVRSVTASLTKTKKVLLITDALEDTQQGGFITRTAWTTGKPFSLIHLISRIIYNHETRPICIIYHHELFGRFWSGIFTPFLIVMLRLTGKRVTIILLTIPRIPPQPTVMQTIRYFLQFTLLVILGILAHQTIIGEKPIASSLSRLTGKKQIVTIPLTFRSLKEGRLAGTIVNDELFPSPTRNLGLLS